MKVAHLVYLFIFSAQLSTTVLAARVEDQRNALIELFNATGGPNWKLNNNWLTNVSYCQWIGLSCIEGTEQVKDIGLKDNGLVGTIPESIGVFDNLDYLSLGENELSGTIPASIGNLKALTWLLLGDNQLSGTIPSSVVHLSKVFDFEMAYNQLTGTIPSNIGVLTKIKILDLRNNLLTGTIPASISAMHELVTFQVNENRLTAIDPDLIVPTSKLQYCLMGNNPLECPLPSTQNFSTLCGAKCVTEAPVTAPHSAPFATAPVVPVSPPTLVPISSPTAAPVSVTQPSHQPMTTSPPPSVHEPSGAAPTSTVEPPKAEQKDEGHLTAIVVLASLLAVAVIGLVVMVIKFVKRRKEDPERQGLMVNNGQVYSRLMDNPE